ncbi:hypothetical protein GCM10010430_58380 [Kitasatospora cystarginea]|uniref:Integral membrane protein n=1 Tax=Kitasatospora cystarginea TaxID=58350 RepID=A0ABP5RLB0_9ACTN
MSSATANEWPAEAGTFSRVRLRFRTWRRTRPFWAGLLAVFASFPILYFPYAQLHLGQLTMSMSTTGGAGSLLIGGLLITLGLTAWFQPMVRIFCGVAVTILSLVSVPVSNLGGFGMGLILGLIAGGLLCSWAPLKEQPVPAGEPIANADGATAEYAAEPGPVAVSAPAAPPVEADPVVSVEKADPEEQQ